MAASSTRAISLRCTTAPSGPVRTTMASYSSGVDKPALHRGHVLHLLARRRGLRADLAGRRNHVLLIDDGAHILGGDAQARHLCRVEPDAHAVVSRSEYHDLAHSAHAGECVVHMQRCEIRQEQIVIPWVVGSDRDNRSRICGCRLATVMPCCRTCAGSWRCAMATWFCTSTAAMSCAVPTSKDTVRL